MAESVSMSYDFTSLINNSRLVQLLCAILQILFIYTESGSLSLFTFLLYSALVGLQIIHLARRWYYNIDGRYDVRQLLRENELTLRIQYAVALFTPTVLGLAMWWMVELNNGLVHLLFHIATFAQLLIGAVQLGFEFYEVFFKSN